MDRLLKTFAAISREGKEFMDRSSDTFHCGQCGTEMGYVDIYEKEDRPAIFLVEGVLTGKNITVI